MLKQDQWMLNTSFGQIVAEGRPQNPYDGWPEVPTFSIELDNDNSPELDKLLVKIWFLSHLYKIAVIMHIDINTGM